MHVHEARGDDAAGGVDGAVGRLVAGSDGDDAAVAHADVGALPRRSGSVDDVAAGDEQIEHGVPLSHPLEPGGR